MLLFELFDSGGELMQQLRQKALDFLMPLKGKNVPYVTVQQVIEALRNDQLGVVINHAWLLKILDPDQVKAIDRIEGDRIYLAKLEDPSYEVSADDQEKDREHVEITAQKQAKKQTANDKH